MATAKGVEITKLDATPRTTLEAASGGGKLRVFMDTIAAGTGDLDNDDIIVLAQVPSNAKLTSIRIYNDDLNSGSGTFNVGLYNGPQAYTISGTTTDAEAVIDEDCYATNSDAFQAATTVTTGTEELITDTRNINAIANFVWEDGGLSEDPKVPLRIAITMSATGTAVAGDITMVVQYVVD
tara:strand:- start:66 stop:608 length:543 start_codon:yes stop_codon:yes gene_type:complete